MRQGVFGRSANFAADERRSERNTDFSDPRDSPELRNAEQNARRALGLTPGKNSVSAGNTQGRARRRFARDGEVAVVVLARSDHAPSDGPAAQSMASPPVNRLAAAEAARDAERTGRQRAERALAEAQAALRNLQTQVGHATMTQDEAVETARLAVAERDVLEAALAAERQARERAEQALAKAVARRGRVAQRPAEPAPSTEAPRQPRVALAERGPRAAKTPDAAKKPARAARRTPEPKPVKWWVKPRG